MDFVKSTHTTSIQCTDSVQCRIIYKPVCEMEWNVFFGGEGGGIKEPLAIIGL
jgi:hypothetical protein